MLGVLMLGGLYLWLRDGDATPTPPMPEEDKEDPLDDDSTPSPTPTPQKWTDTAEWSGEYIATGPQGENVVWFYRTGIRYEDGTTEMSSTTYIVIGDANHHAFLRSNSNRGTIDIPKRFSGGSVDMKNVQVFSDLQTASDKADKLSNPPPRDPTDPVQPQPEPEEEDEPSRPSGPTLPDYGFGGSNSTPFGGGF